MSQTVPSLSRKQQQVAKNLKTYSQQVFSPILWQSNNQNSSKKKKKAQRGTILQEQQDNLRNFKQNGTEQNTKWRDVSLSFPIHQMEDMKRSFSTVCNAADLGFYLIMIRRSRRRKERRRTGGEKKMAMEDAQGCKRPRGSKTKLLGMRTRIRTTLSDPFGAKWL